jgi:hypothetical protein
VQSSILQFPLQAYPKGVETQSEFEGIFLVGFIKKKEKEEKKKRDRKNFVC